MSESEDYSSNDESITDYSSDESFNDEELDGVHDRLLSAIDRFSGNQNGSHVSTNQNAVEDAFSSALTTGTVSMSDLLGALDNTKGLSAVKKKLSDFEKGLAAPAFVEKVAAQRVERSVVYGESAKDMGKWQDVVAANRNVRTLDLAQDKRQLASYRSLITKFSAENDMEREIQMVLVETGATDAEALRREEDELGSRHISVEDMRKKQIELAKVKARMFYEQMKGRRLNKIKSKAYHRIKKRQRQRRENDEMEKIAEADPEAAEQILEAKAATRIKERMTLRHRNTTKWARMALEHGKGDASLKSAYHEAVQLGHELLDKVNEVEHKSGSDGGSGDDWSDDSQSSDGEGDHGDDRKTSKKKKSSVAVKAARQLSKVLADPVEGGNLTAAGQSGRYQRLFDMDFMRKANEMQQSRAREEAQNVLLELQGLEEEDVSTDDEGDIGDSVGTATSVPKKRDAEEKQKLAVARAEMDRLFAGSQGMTATTNRGAKVKRSAGIALDTSQEQALPPQSITTTATKAVAFATTKANTEPELVSEAADVNDAQTNPWLQPVRAEGKGKGKKQEQQKLKPSLKAQQQISDVNQQKQLPAAATASSSGVNIDTTKKIDQSLKQNDNKGGHKKQIPKSSQNQSEGIGGTTAPAPVTVSISTDNVNEADKAKKQPAERKPLLMQKSQADLVQIAFAGPDLEAEFLDFKNKSIGDELGFAGKRKDVLSQVKAGWGDWAGPGSMMVSAKIQRMRDSKLKKIDAAEEQAKGNRADRKMANVVLSERRIKTAAKFVIDTVPHPFTSREEYERSLQMPLGAEWNASHVVHSNTKPDILTRAGRIIEPIKLSANKKRAVDSVSVEPSTGKKIRTSKAATSSKAAKRIS